MIFTDYKPPFLLRNGHLNTIYAPLFRRQKSLAFIRERLNLPDGDFLDLDFLRANHRRLVILCHGLEGSSSSQYMIGLSSIFHANNWDVLAINYRGCSGEMNRAVRMYHSGATGDLDFVIQSVKHQYDALALVGVSLGGNMVSVYAGQQAENIDPKIKGIVGISVPTNLLAGVHKIMQASNYIYERRFLKSLLTKMRLKARQYPEIFTEEKIRSVRTIYEFDDTFTGPISGFKDAKDYYTKCSSGQFIPKIRVPTLIINALDDPFLPDECYPSKEMISNKFVTLLYPEYGGHVGFVQFGQKHYWEEKIALQFLMSVV